MSGVGSGCLRLEFMPWGEETLSLATFLVPKMNNHLSSSSPVDYTMLKRLLVSSNP